MKRQAQQHHFQLMSYRTSSRRHKKHAQGCLISTFDTVAKNQKQIAMPSTEIWINPNLMHYGAFHLRRVPACLVRRQTYPY